MIEDIVKYFRGKKVFYEFENIDLNLLNYIFASPQQIFGISVLENEINLIKNWEKVSQEFAVRIQSQLKDTLYNLKWDMYLILVVETTIREIETCKQIENDRMFFKKFVISKDMKDFMKKLPIDLEIDNSEELHTFSDKEFLSELKKIISTEIVERIDFTIYENSSIEDVNYNVFLEPYTQKE